MAPPPTTSGVPTHQDHQPAGEPGEPITPDHNPKPGP